MHPNTPLYPLITQVTQSLQQGKIREELCIECPDFNFKLSEICSGNFLEQNAALLLKVYKLIDYWIDHHRHHKTELPEPSRLTDLKKKPKESWLTSQQAAWISGYSVSTIKRYGDSGYITIKKTKKGHRRYLESSVQSLKPLLPETPRPTFPQKPESSLPSPTVKKVYDSMAFEITKYRIISQFYRHIAPTSVVNAALHGVKMMEELVVLVPDFDFKDLETCDSRKFSNRIFFEQRVRERLANKIIPQSEIEKKALSKKPTVNHENNPKLDALSIRDFSQQKEMSQNTIRRLSDSGVIPCFKTPKGTRRYLKSEIEKG